MRADGMAIAAWHKAFILMLVSTFGMTSTLAIWLFSGCFYALSVLALVCMLLGALLFGFAEQQRPRRPRGLPTARAGGMGTSRLSSPMPGVTHAAEASAFKSHD